MHNIPGIFSGSLRLAFHQHLQDNRDSLAGEDLRTLILDTLKLLKANIEELRESEAHTREEMSRLISRYDELEKDIVKNVLRTDNLEQKLKQVNARPLETVKFKEEPGNDKRDISHV